MVNENEEPLQFPSETIPFSVMSRLKTTGAYITSEKISNVGL